MVQILNFDPVSWVVDPSFDPGFDLGTRGLIVDAVAVDLGIDPVCNASLACEPIDPEIVFDDLVYILMHSVRLHARLILYLQVSGTIS